MGQIFISYKSEDRDHAQSLAMALEARGHAVWWDRELKAGSQFRDAIADELKSCEVVIVIWTPRSVRSPWVQDEADYASRNKKLLPVRVCRGDNDNVVNLELPLGFGQIHAEDLTYWDGSPGDPVIDSISNSIQAINDQRWGQLLRVSGFARRDAARFFSNISTEIGGLPFSSLFFGALGLALIGTFFTVFGLLFVGDFRTILPSLYLLPISVGGVALARTMFQFVIITSGKSSRHFFDHSFTLVFMFSAMIAILCVAWVEYRSPYKDPLDLLVYGPIVTLLIMLLTGIVRVSMTGARLLFSRL